MKTTPRFLALLLCLVTVLMGCQRTTTVILPPDTEPAATPTQASTSSPPTGPSATEARNSDPRPSDEPSVTDATEAPTAYSPPVSTAPPNTAPSTDPGPTQHPVYDISSHQTGSQEYGLLEAINFQRTARELPKLTLDPTLCALATIRSYECTNSFSHTRPDGRNGISVLSDYGYSIWSNLDERIHYSTPGFTSDSIVGWWMKNEGFSGSILSDLYTAIGIGIYTHGTVTYITCIFVG